MFSELFYYNLIGWPPSHLQYDRCHLKLSVDCSFDRLYLRVGLIFLIRFFPHFSMELSRRLVWREQSQRNLHFRITLMPNGSQKILGVSTILFVSTCVVFFGVPRRGPASMYNFILGNCYLLINGTNSKQQVHNSFSFFWVCSQVWMSYSSKFSK